uniref:Large ribosomal subunit protein bL25 n=1 Tax=Desulfomonile tiedjei TaxID=2358 RepID=A0A7C4EY88_9BACT
MNRIALEVEQRTETGKGPSRRLRAAGKVPAVLYGKKAQPLSLTLNKLDLMKAVEKAGTNPIFQLNIKGAGGAATRSAILKERQIRPLDSTLLHIDFLEVSMDEALEVHVPIECEGTPVGVEKGGIFQQVVRELKVRCLPGDIPNVIKVDVTRLELGHAIHVSDLPLPSGVTAAEEPGTAIATVVAPRKEEEHAPEEAAPSESETGE